MASTTDPTDVRVGGDGDDCGGGGGGGGGFMSSQWTAAHLPSSPAARAFFLALDQGTTETGGEGARRSADNNDDDIHRDAKGQSSSSLPSSSSSKPSTKTSTTSPFIRKRLQTLGWRNRHSQAPLYPLTIQHSRRPSANNGATTSTLLEVVQVQRGEVDGTYGTGATVWPAAVVLCKYLETHATTLVQNKCIIDLGAGTGITSLTCAVLGAHSVLCTDGPTSVVQLAHDNVRRVANTQAAVTAATNAAAGAAPQPRTQSTLANEEPIIDPNEEEECGTMDKGTEICGIVAGCPITVVSYWWGSGSLSLSYPSCDAVLVSDCVLPKLYPIEPLVDALDELLVKPTAMAILSYEHRHYPDYDPRDKFRSLAAAKHLQVHVVPLEEQHDIYSVDDIEIWKVTRCL